MVNKSGLFPILLIPLLFNFLSCTDKKEDPKPVTKKVFVLGDPIKLVEGASMGSYVEFPDDIINRNQFMIWGQHSFVEREDEEISMDIKEGNGSKEGSGYEEANLTDSQKSTAFFRQYKIQKNVEGYDYVIKNAYVRLGVLNKSSKVKIKLLEEDQGEEFVGQVLHFSASENYEAFSLMVYHSTPGGRTLTVFYFGSPEYMSGATEFDGSKYFYLQGQGVPFRWNQQQPFKINFCHKKGDKSKYFRFAQNALRAWQKPLEGRLELQIDIKKQYPPFSDFGVRCIYVVPDFFMKPHRNAIGGGQTVNIPNYKVKSFFDSDILIYEKEEQKYWDVFDSEYGIKISSLTSQQRRQVQKAINKESLYFMTHEMGHMLGLAHAFTEANPEGEFSIMNYESSKQITDYDVEAITHLYPIPSNETPEDSKSSGPFNEYKL